MSAKRTEATTSRRQGQSREGLSGGSPSGAGDRVNAAVVHRQFTFLSGEICRASGPCAYGSRTEAQSERAGIAIEP
jgi:hypothetical protein